MRRPGTPVLVLLLLLPVLLLLHSHTGSAHISVLTALQDLFHGRSSIASLIFVEVRLPRSLLAMSVGISLALSGAALQGLLRNPLASPGLLGVSQSAALMAVITLYYGFSNLAWFVLPMAALGGALLSVIVIFILAGRYSSILSVILLGIAINAMTGAFTSLALTFAPNPYALQEIYYWMLGSVANRSLNEFYFALPFMLLGWGLLLHSRRFLDAMTLGEDTAQSLGFDTARQKWLIIVGVACCTGAAVAVSGNIAFVGLVVPHLLRPLVQHEPGRLLWASALGGAVLLLLADITVQGISSGQELPLGVVTAALGGPFFLFLVYRNRHIYQ
ncbi:MAG: iron ABC transporter permease [Pseudomonadales bacterium]|nr:iron ABC transporter permease [Pseudomonadales bacterium]